MPKLPEMREGVELTAYGRSIPFSFWPTAPGSPRPSIQSTLFVIDPWLMMRRAVVDSASASAESKAEALSYIEQARDYFVSAQASNVGAAKPVQIYYCYLNIAKAFAICRGVRASLPNIQHGISEFVPVGAKEFDDAVIGVHISPSPRGKLQAFDEFMSALGARRVVTGEQHQLSQLIPQVLSGHRLWADAADKTERFIALQRIQFIQNRDAGEVWLRMYLFADDISRLSYSQNDLLVHSGLRPDFRKVSCAEVVEGRALHCLEQRVPDTFVRHGVDLAPTLVSRVKPHLWATVGSSPPYRRYYLYLCPPAEQNSLLAQIAAMYAVAFYSGSVTRYRPNAFQAILDGPFGPRVAEFISGQPAQFVYLMASEFAKRDVTRPSIVN